MEEDTRTVFGLTTNGNGVVTDLCLLGTTGDPDGAYVKCVAKEIKAAAPVLEPRLDESPWVLTFFLD